MTNQSVSIDFNQRVGANLQRIRKAAGWSQSDLANQLSLRGLPFQQQTILKIEKGARPLKFEEADAIAAVLGIDLASLSQYIDDEAIAEAVALLQRINLTAAKWHRYLEEELPEQTRKSEQDARQFLERNAAARREAEQRLREAGGVQGGDGHWRTNDGRVLFVDDVREAENV